MTDLTTTEIRKLAGVHPRLIEKVKRILYAMAELGVPMLVTDGLRSDAQQQALFAKGRTAPGKKVTNADGIRKRSNHQAKADGFGYAVDCCFLKDGQPSWDNAHPWRLYGEAAKALGLRWGGEWVGLPDRPHIELPEED